MVWLPKEETDDRVVAIDWEREPAEAVVAGSIVCDTDETKDCVEEDADDEVESSPSTTGEIDEAAALATPLEGAVDDMVEGFEPEETGDAEEAAVSPAELPEAELVLTTDGAETDG